MPLADVGGRDLGAPDLATDRDGVVLDVRLAVASRM
jgi:hypothetical protein